jgi:TPR repeat protein
MLRRTTLVLNITERKSENECQLIESAVRELSARELDDIPVKLLYTGEVYEEFYSLSKEMRRKYSDTELLTGWNDIREAIDEIARKYNSETVETSVSDFLEKSVKWEEIDYTDVSETVLRQYAENNVAGAQYDLAKRLLLKEDYYGAVKYLRALADNNHGDAMYALSQCYLEGNGVEQNMDAAISWNRTAADAGVTEAQFLMYTYLSNGKHMKENMPRAISYLKMAAYSQHAHASALLGQLYLAGIDIPVNYDLGVKYLTAAVDAGDADAMVALAVSHKKGLGVKKDLVEMYRLLERAAALNQPDALVALGDAYAAGTDVDVDKNKAFKYYMRAADACAADAQMRVGTCYENGIGVNADPALAIAYYTRAAENGDESAQQHLGAVYNNGVLVPKDVEKAKHWLRLASASGNTTARDLLYEIGDDSPDNSGARGSGKCFVVTASFGDEHAPEVLFFQTFRDTILARHAAGRKCISLYYRVGPYGARIIGRHRVLRALTRRILLRLQHCLTIVYGSECGGRNDRS